MRLMACRMSSIWTFDSYKHKKQPGIDPGCFYNDLKGQIWLEGLLYPHVILLERLVKT